MTIIKQQKLLNSFVAGIIKSGHQKIDFANGLWIGIGIDDNN